MPSGWTRNGATALVVGALLLVGCSSAPTDDTPSGALRLFLRAMDRSQRDPAALEEAYQLMSRPTRRTLVERARLAQTLGGDAEPWEMIAHHRFRQTIVPASSHGMRERIDGDRATVLVRARDGDRTAEVPMVRENGRWRVVIDIPPVRRTGPGG